MGRFGHVEDVIKQRCAPGEPQALAPLMQVVSPAKGGIMWRTSKESVKVLQTHVDHLTIGSTLIFCRWSHGTNPARGDA
jgi:hypothetical protein